MDSVGHIKPRLPGKFESLNYPGRILNQEYSAPNVDIHPLNNGRTEITETSKKNEPKLNENSISSSTALSSMNDVSPNSESFHLAKDFSQEETNIPQISNIDYKANLKPIAIEPLMNSRFKYDLPIANSKGVEEVDSAIINSKADKSNLIDKSNELTNEKLTLLKAQIIQPLSEKSKTEKELPNTIYSSSKLPGLENTNRRSIKLFTESLPQQSMSTVIKVSIGRIEVRAISPPAELKIKRDSVQKPRMSLEDYLKKRNSSK